MMDRRSSLLAVSPVYNHAILRGRDAETDSFYGTYQCCLHVALTTRVTDPRDKVFALRSIFPNTLWPVTVDYKAPIEEIFTEAARCVILHEQNPLNMLELLQPSLSRPKLPSWVPDLSLTFATIPEMDTTFVKPSNSRSKPFLNGQSLVVQGYEIDTIEICGDVFPRVLVQPGETISDVQKRGDTIIYTQKMVQSISVLRKWCQVVADYGLYRSMAREESIAMLISSIMHRLLFRHSKNSGADEKLERDLHMYFVLIDVGTDNSDSLSTDELESAITLDEPYPWRRDDSSIEPMGRADLVQPNSLEAKILIGILMCEFGVLHCRLHLLFQNAKFFITRLGRIGFGDATIEPGNIVALFAGGRVPYIIGVNQETQYLKGRAFLNGAMEGEDWPDDESLLRDFVIS